MMTLGLGLDPMAPLPDVPSPIDPMAYSAPQVPLQPLKLSPVGKVYVALSTISAILSGYHGYKRNNSIGWAIGWFALGGIFPVITPTIAFAQGFGKRA